MPALAILDHTAELQRAILIAQSMAKENRHPHYGPAHLLQGILHDDVGLSSLLIGFGKDIHYLRDWADIQLKKVLKSARVPEAPPADDRTRKTLEVADVVRLKLSLSAVSPFCVLVALCRPGVAFEVDQLKSFPLTEKELLEAELGRAENTAAPRQSKTGSSPSPSRQTSSDHLARFCINKTARAEEGDFDPIIGRDREITELIKILGRRTKPNVLIVGEPGVGKTALVEGFAQNIVDLRVPTFLLEAEVLELDLGALIAGASYKGEIEDRIKGAIKALKARETKTILFIDEIHLLLDPKGGASGIANLLKPELARGALTLIGATTLEEYQKYIERDDAFSRRFANLKVDEPSPEAAIRMLTQLAPKYEAHHGLGIAPAAIEASVQLARRYLRDRQLPDSAIDLMDRTLSATAVMKDSTAQELERLRQQLEQIMATKASDPQQRSELYWLYQQLQDRISPILLEQLSKAKDLSGFSDAPSLAAYIQVRIASLDTFEVETKERVEATDVMAAVAAATGIPMGKLQADERAKLTQLADRLNARVIGQQHAVDTLVHAINISRAGLADRGRPVGAFFFLGPTGTGKTELAKALAQELFNDERALLRFDMSEYTESHTAQFLTGAPPGYVGYEEGGALVNAIRRQPYSILLFDEIEKAHPEVFKVFLQILDDGKLTDKLGKEGDFTNAIILFTSNIGSGYILDKFGQGETPGQQELTEAMSQHFKDEFLGRLTEIIPFAPISEENINKIFRIQLRRLEKSLEQKDITLVLSDEALRYLALKGFSPRFGARPLRRVILNDLQKPLAGKIIAGQLKDGQTVQVGYDTEEGISWHIK